MRAQAAPDAGVPASAGEANVVARLVNLDPGLFAFSIAGSAPWQEIAAGVRRPPGPPPLPPPPPGPPAANNTAAGGAAARCAGAPPHNSLPRPRPRGGPAR